MAGGLLPITRSRKTRFLQGCCSKSVTVGSTNASPQVYGFCVDQISWWSLDADDKVLLERIATRGRAYERPITTEYLDSVRDASERYLDTGAEPSVLRVNTTNLDLQMRWGR